MSRYYSYNDFMSDVLTCAEEFCKNTCGHTLSQYAGVSWITYVGIRNLVAKRLSLLWSLENFLEGFIKKFPIISAMAMWAISRFLSTRVGQEIANILGARASEIIQELYQNRILLPTISKICIAYQGRWEAAEGCRSDIDALMEEATDSLMKELSVI